MPSGSRATTPPEHVMPCMREGPPCGHGGPSSWSGVRQCVAGAGVAPPAGWRRSLKSTFGTAFAASGTG